MELAILGCFFEKKGHGLLGVKKIIYDACFLIQFPYLPKKKVEIACHH
jgi:hypothetical protein